MEGNGAPVTAQDRLLGAAMIVGPLLLLISTVAYAAGGGINNDRAGGPSRSTPWPCGSWS